MARRDAQPGPEPPPEPDVPSPGPDRASSPPLPPLPLPELLPSSPLPGPELSSSPPPGPELSSPPPGPELPPLSSLSSGDSDGVGVGTVTGGLLGGTEGGVVGARGATVGAGLGSGAVGRGDSAGPGPSRFRAPAAPRVATPARDTPAIATTRTYPSAADRASAGRPVRSDAHACRTLSPKPAMRP